ncbi:peptidase M23 [Coprococcus comes]|uniref:Peptidase M23 n=1 Tax=Blautia massiliensis (ex Durand et al. 2017) TaxID=1737424 RepID=A0ABW9X738_9FIRM|nr:MULTISPECIES: lysozyme family protein [Lachnospiraceae]MZL72778.1 peptidase M23 [Blautia massiliensis (ex Durand et al. 2017)]MZL77931.1 peptidase M23 [Blautia massiliensis (ex Durand et al. 2017)]NSC80475.1 peptidase M23 [Coprococcus comes]NSE67467.1 peptidase M23 [Coprococcus comes]NSE70392.1 peptidase M23 [Coprococcus comes]
MPKTALMGSPLAVIGTVFRHRRTLAKTGAAVGGVLMLPILFLVMLPGLVFGDLSENTGALTSNTVISENIRASNQAIVEVLQESHDALLAKINAEIARLPEGDTASISDPYASSIIVNANQLIAQFCASQDDYKNINISKLKSLIRENEDGLFSYDVTSETATVEVPAEEENAPPRKVTFTRHTYTVSYAGDAYFADHVFHLTDKQKKTADSYVENLTMFFGGSASGLAMAVGVSDEVLAYRATIQQVAQKYGMEAYVELLMAVMMQESGGRGSDPMQAAEGGFNKKYPHVPNGITDPAYSIECGIQELKYALDKAGCTGPTDLDRIKLALQGYNYGSGYIDWAMERDGGYTKENAIAYSDMMCARPNWHYARYGDKEYVEHVLRYYQITNTGGSYPANGMQIPHYLQTDYGNIPYGGGSIASSGCGPTSFAMIASYLTGNTITPPDAVAWCGNSYYKPGVGTYWSYFQAAASHFGCGSVTQTSNANTVLQALSEGCPVISSQRAGLFTSGGHFIVLRGVTANGKVLVNDPNDSDAKNYINREFDMMSEIHATANAYWIFDKK